MDRLPGPAMAEHAQYPIDVTELWGPDGETELSPATPFTPPPDRYPADAKPTNGNGESVHGVNKQTLDDVARLASAIAANHSDGLRRIDFDAMRTELESAFAQQLALALYELMSAWSSRFSTAEDNISERVARSVEAQTRVLASSTEAIFYEVLGIAETVRSELAAFRTQLAGIEVLIASGLAEPAETSDLSETMRGMRAELAELRLEIVELRGSITAPAEEGVSLSTP
jgi:hypothetical protein